MRINIGTRGSRLALAQAELVQKAIEQRFPEIETALVTVRTRGDRVQDQPLSALGGNGVFVKEIEHALYSGAIDLAVHSAKDMPVQLGEGLCIGAVLPRGAVEDVLVTQKGVTVPHIIGTGSLRRRLFVQKLFPEAEIRGIRGNVDTRLQKLLDGDYDGVILAAAGLRRLGLPYHEQLEYRELPVTQMLPAACQGIIAVECRKGELMELLSGINDAPTMTALQTERHVLALLGGDCSLPVGALAQYEGDALRLTVTKDCETVLTDTAPVSETLALAERLVGRL